MLYIFSGHCIVIIYVDNMLYQFSHFVVFENVQFCGRRMCLTYGSARPIFYQFLNMYCSIDASYILCILRTKCNASGGKCCECVIYCYGDSCYVVRISSVVYIGMVGILLFIQLFLSHMIVFT